MNNNFLQQVQKKLTDSLQQAVIFFCLQGVKITTAQLLHLMLKLNTSNFKTSYSEQNRLIQIFADIPIIQQPFFNSLGGQKSVHKKDKEWSPK